MRQLKKNLRHIIKSENYSHGAKAFCKILIKDAKDLKLLMSISDYTFISIDWLVRKDLSEKTNKQIFNNYKRVKEKLKTYEK